MPAAPQPSEDGRRLFGTADRRVGTGASFGPIKKYRATVRKVLFVADAFKPYRELVKILQVTLISLALLAAASCSRKSDSDRKDRSDKTSEHQSEVANSPEREETETQPSEDDIMDDCHAFAWLTKAMPAKTKSADCPQCPSGAEGTEVLNFQGAKVDRVSCAGGTCEVAVSLHASFNPSKGGTITGGLTGWIPLEQREQYSRGETPPGEHVYHLNITYRHEGDHWQLVDFAMGGTTDQGR
jgi:hypothetical protein